MEKNIKIKPIKETTFRLLLVGDGDLILCKKSRRYEQSDVWKQNHDKGATMPEKYLRKNKWEEFITSITWEHPIDFHDDDIGLYTEDEWKYYMENNRPCILSYAFLKNFKEAFISLGFKESTNKNGTDIERSLTFSRRINPIIFAKATPKSMLVPNNTQSRTNVVCNQNIFSGWECEITMSVPDKIFPAETIINIVQTAGKYIGIGAARKSGYGRYHIEKASLLR